MLRTAASIERHWSHGLFSCCIGRLKVIRFTNAGTEPRLLFIYLFFKDDHEKKGLVLI